MKIRHTTYITLTTHSWPPLLTHKKFMYHNTPSQHITSVTHLHERNTGKIYIPQLV